MSTAVDSNGAPVTTAAAQPPSPKPVKADEIPNGAFVVKTPNSTYSFGPADGRGIRTITKDGKHMEGDPHCKIKSLTRGRPMSLTLYYAYTGSCKTGPVELITIA